MCRKKGLALLLALLCLLAACGRGGRTGEDGGAGSSRPTQEATEEDGGAGAPRPTQEATGEDGAPGSSRPTQQIPDPTQQIPDPTQQAPSPTEEVRELWGFPIDDTHDAFEVPTGGKLGTVLVTVEIENEDAAGYSFSVWAADDLEQPFQTMTAERFNTFHWYEVVDANFDGYMDFGYMYAMGNQPTYWHYWIWDEAKERFVQEPEFDTISQPDFDAEAETISGWARNSAAGDGVTTFHRWEDGKLVCVRRIETWWDSEAATVSVEDRVDGKLEEVYYREFPPEDEREGHALWWQEANKWEDLNYHGEEN